VLLVRHLRCERARRRQRLRRGRLPIRRGTHLEWHWARPDDKRVPWQRLAALPIEPPSLLRKQAALAAHTSQLEPRSNALGPVLDPLICALAGRACERFFV
jgi:hypothetical protein